MPYICAIERCEGMTGNGCHLFSLPLEETARQRWTNAIPYFNKSKTSETYFKICSRHWPSPLYAPLSRSVLLKWNQSEHSKNHYQS